MTSESLNVVALISGGKDSFFNLLHCVHHGHRIVALANLFPSTGTSSASDVLFIDPAQLPPSADQGDRSEERDLNSFMYQTVGHEVIPLYAAATGLPLYRQPIHGASVHHERDYDCSTEGQGPNQPSDETESMLALLKAIKTRHPEANAICSGAILSTYQRTRVESVALRLGLSPLAYLWKYPVLPPPLTATAGDEAQLLLDMATAGLEARIIKVASAGLDESHLWERVSSPKGVSRVKSALKKFGFAEGAVLGEGGEFETLVLDGPSCLFKKAIAIPESGRAAIHEGGGSIWLMLRGAQLQPKSSEAGSTLSIRVPDLIDARFQAVLDSVLTASLDQDEMQEDSLGPDRSTILDKTLRFDGNDGDTFRWSIWADSGVDYTSIEAETQCVVSKIRGLASSARLDTADITNTVVILRGMSDFPKINAEYGKLFTKPNPPSRVTIACGDLLPAGHNIMVFLTAPKAGVKSNREGLHVQSRSYWAPANIGPYSQAVDVAVMAKQEPTGLRSIHIAGQIPLIPSSMMLLAPSATSLQTQIVLSLQHLWRIGVQMKVQYWTSAVAYFARSSSLADMERNARLAGLAWYLAHGSPEDEEDGETGPDPWDLKYNPQHMSLSGGDQKARVSLPDWSIFSLRQQNEPKSCLPPLFSAEIEELPRQSTVEWHAHTGLSRVNESNAEVVYYPQLSPSGWRAWHVLVRTSSATLVYTTLATTLSGGPGSRATDITGLKGVMSEAYVDAIRRLGLEVPTQLPEAPHLAYIDVVNAASLSSEVGDASRSLPMAMIPCRSIWSSKGERMGCVATYQATLTT